MIRKYRTGKDSGMNEATRVALIAPETKNAVQKRLHLSWLERQIKQNPCGTGVFQAEVIGSIPVNPILIPSPAPCLSRLQGFRQRLPLFPEVDQTG